MLEIEGEALPVETFSRRHLGLDLSGSVFGW
jgi:hypothetical protein